MRRLVLGVSLLVGCDNVVPWKDHVDDNPGGVDADAQTVRGDATPCIRDTEPNCWPEPAVRVPHGSITLGLGRGGYQPMPDDVPLEWGLQDGFMFVLSARMTGFEPGIPGCSLDARNPRTRIRAFFDDTNVALNTGARCPFRTVYRPMGDGQYEMVQEVGVVFSTCWRSDRLIGKRIRIEAEILEQNGNSATEARVVTAVAPLDPNYPAETDTPPCP